MVGWHYEEKTGIRTRYSFEIEGVWLDLHDSQRPGATISFYEQGIWESGDESERELLYTTRDCPKVLRWTPPEPLYYGYGSGVEVEYCKDGCMHQEVLATHEEVDEMASQAEYDERNEAHIAITRTLYIGTSTVCLKVKRKQGYTSPIQYDVRICVEFASKEEYTHFVREDMNSRRFRHRLIPKEDTHVDVIDSDDILRTVCAIAYDHRSARRNALRRGIPCSQFVEECHQLETKLICHQGFNRGDDQPCYLTCTLHLTSHTSIGIVWHTRHVDWSATSTNIPSSFPSLPHAFQSLNNIHLNFPSATQHDCHNRALPSRNSIDTLNFTVEATGIYGLTGTNSVARENSITIASEHCNVHVNLAGLHGISLNINFMSGDSFFGPISSGNVGGRNNFNSSMVESCLPRGPPLSTRSHDLALL